MKEKETKVLSVSLQKGGVGKSTLSLNLAYSLSKLGYKVLLLDMDPQATSSLLLNVDITDENIPGMQDALDYFMNSMIGGHNFDINAIKKCILRPTYPRYSRDFKKTYEEVGFDLIPSRIELANYDIALANFAIDGRNYGGYVLKNLIEKMKESLDYDYIICDVLPGLNMIAYNCIAASYNGGVIMPITMDKSAITGGENLLNCVTEIQQLLWKNNKLKHNGILGVVKNEYKPRLKVTQDIEKNLYDYFGPAHIFENSIPSKASCDKAHSDNRLYAEFDKAVGKIFLNLAQEVVDEIHRREPETEPIFIEKFGKEYLDEQTQKQN